MIKEYIVRTSDGVISIIEADGKDRVDNFLRFLVEGEVVAIFNMNFIISIVYNSKSIRYEKKTT